MWPIYQKHAYALIHCSNSLERQSWISTPEVTIWKDEILENSTAFSNSKPTAIHSAKLQEEFQH